MVEEICSSEYLTTLRREIENELKRKYQATDKELQAVLEKLGLGQGHNQSDET